MRHRPDLVVRLALLSALAASTVSAEQADPLVDTPPPPEAVCPAIAEDYELCRADPRSGNCDDFVSAAHALGRLYLFNVQREPEREAELKTTVWWQCGAATFAELKTLLLTIDSPAARSVLTESPYRSLAVPPVRPPPPAGHPIRKAPDAPDCSSSATPAERDACDRSALAAARAQHEKEVARCRSTLPPFLRQQFETAESAWQTDQGNECQPGEEGETLCLAETTRERDRALADGCGFGGPDQAEPAVAGIGEGGPQTGMLPARWTPPQGQAQPVSFTFETRGRDTSQGTMHTTLGAGGESFDGRYLRIEQSTEGKLVTAMSVDWSGPEWELWQHDADGHWVQEGVSVGEFAHFYTGKVLASLQGDHGHAMRCQLELKNPDAGLLSGGTGRCQVTDGGSLTLDF